MSGLVLLAPEGINGTVAGDSESIEDYKSFVQSELGEIRFKDSISKVPPFHRTSVDIRREIVGMKRPDLVPTRAEDNHLSPSEWHAFLESDRPRLLIDTRNRYETQLGIFEGAVDPNLASFSDWSAYFDESKIDPSTPVLIYCTGGIRCEKVMLEMRSRGFGEVYQLRDGILGYLAEFPEGHFKGECFVFDDRVALDAHLQPTQRYGICPACGLPSGNRKTCGWCEGTFYLCEGCEEKWPGACSKTCRDRIERHGYRPAR